MKLLGTIVAELLALFVDDGRLVLAVILWVLVGAICLRAEIVPPSVEALLLFVGIAALLGNNVVRAARAHVATPDC
jgi:hypothetical protein